MLQRNHTRSIHKTVLDIPIKWNLCQSMIEQAKDTNLSVVF